MTDSDGNPLSASINPDVAQASDTALAGTVEQVWEDGFRFNTGDRTFTVDSWEMCGDSTASHVNEGDRLTVTGEFDEGEFDAFSITDSSDNAVCEQVTSLQESY
ncbi:MAG: hypothetical protein F6K30_26470 [Cyanothece sp. SIO2G6]|nr:hypothetical protein [Cyanothece sp. SIO2G6]